MGSDLLTRSPYLFSDEASIRPSQEADLPLVKLVRILTVIEFPPVPIPGL